MQIEDRLTGKLMVREGITEQLNTRDMMAWVWKRNSIVNRVREIVDAYAAKNSSVPDLSQKAKVLLNSYDRNDR